MKKTLPTFEIEREYEGLLIAGVDEAGRGPLCGPVIAAAVIIPISLWKRNEIDLINDSKKMTKARRESVYEWIKENCVCAVGESSPTEIDEINILQASLLAMTRAVSGLELSPDFVLVDGNRVPKNIIGRAIVKGDAKSISIAAASIVAKVMRDQIMTELAQEFPEYGWDKNMGYPTVMHLEAIQNHGINQHYRKSFKPVKKLLNNK